MPMTSSRTGAYDGMNGFFLSPIPIGVLFGGFYHPVQIDPSLLKVLKPALVLPTPQILKNISLAVSTEISGTHTRLDCFDTLYVATGIVARMLNGIIRRAGVRGRGSRIFHK